MEEKLKFDSNIPDEKQEWITAWIRTTDMTNIERFLFAMTGSRALGNIDLKIHSSPSSIHFHTCFNSVDLPLGVIESIKSQEDMNAFMESTLTKGPEKYSRG